MNAQKLQDIIDRVTKAVIEQQVEGEIEITPDNVRIAIRPWKPYEMRCPYNYGPEKQGEQEQ